MVQQMRIKPAIQVSESAHILVVDDEPEIADSLSEFLSRTEGYRITVASDGRQAMSLLEASIGDPSRAIDLVLLDVRMPFVSGPEVLHWLRRHPALKYTRVIVLTAAAGNEEKVEALSAGADDYIIKPYYPLELLARVKTILRTQQLEKQLQRQSQQLAALNRVSRAVTAKLATDEVLAKAVKGVISVIGAEQAAVFMVDADRSLLQCRQACMEAGYLNIEGYPLVPVGQGITGLAYQEAQSLSLNDPETDLRFRPSLDAPGGYRVRSIMAAPIFVRGQAVGVLNALNKIDGVFSDVDRGLFASLASTVSRAIEITWLFKSVRQRQQELLESRNTLQAVIDGILHPIYTINEEWQIVAVNLTKAEELDKPLGDVVGKTCYSVIFNRNVPCEHCAVALTLAEKQARRWSVKWPGQGLQQQEWDVNAYPVPGSKAGAARAVVVWQDRTEERRLESSLMQASKLTAIGQLATGVAHEINNPLTVVNANAQMLQMILPPQHEGIESVELIAQAGDRAAKVVRGLLDFARQTRYEFRPAEINDSIRSALNLVSYQFTTAKIEVVTEFSENLPNIDASWEHLQSVWLNLLINARDALLEVDGERQIDLITRFDPSDQFVQVLVSDSGLGMNTAEQAHIFEPFYTTKAPGQGTGLGLATCHRIIEQHGGEITVASAPGEGTTFLIRLPVHTARDVYQERLPLS
jgi:two-component system NtrC family sensor kinase